MVSEILFPFDEIRPVQENLIEDVKIAVENGEHLIAHAPTGLGKTAAVFSAAVAYAIKNNKTVFFLTPKHSQHQIAVETLQEIKKKFNLDFSAVDLIGKKWMCPVEGVSELTTFEFREHCRIQRKNNACIYYKNTFKNNKISSEIKEILEEMRKNSPEHVENFVEHCKNLDLCAYELSSELCENATVIIADYYHLFHPKIREHFLKKIGKDLSKSIVIVDEAHNLPSRIMDIMSSKLTTSMLRRAAKEARAFLYNDLAISIRYVSDALENLALKLELVGESGNSEEMHILKEDFFNAVEEATGEDYALLLKDLEDAAEKIREEHKRSSVGGVAGFLESWLGSDKGYCRVLKREYKQKDAVSLSYNCLSASIVSGPVADETWSTILMSGTLTPGKMYSDVLGFDENRVVLREYPNPFPSKNRLVLIDPDVTTKFTERSETQWKQIGLRAAQITNEVPGNSAIFFPSYGIMQSVLPFIEKEAKKEIMVEEQDIKKEQKKDFIEAFKSNSNTGGAVLLGVQGGSLSEGIDLPGDFLKAVLVVGVPLSRPDLLTKALIDFYDKKYGKGWEYGYLFPAINRTLQAAGRCIRSHTDKGAIIFMDKRFSWDLYSKYIPSDWDARKTSMPSVNIKRFFI